MIAIVFLPILLIFIAVIIVIAFLVVLRTTRSRSKSLPNPSPPEMQQQTTREEVVKREVIVKIRCAYCGAQFDGTLDKCPNCGALH